MVTRRAEITIDTVDALPLNAVQRRTRASVTHDTIMLYTWEEREGGREGMGGGSEGGREGGKEGGREGGDQTRKVG